MPEEPIGFDELRQRVDDGDTSLVLLNVLARTAFEAGRIPTSLNLPVQEITERAAEVLPAPDQETVVYSASSSCTLAPQGVQLLRTLGYTNVREYDGGIEEWAERGGRVERDAPSVVDAPPPSLRDKVARLLARLSPATAFAWASNQSLPVLFAIWLGTSTVFALLYWLAGGGAMALTEGSRPLLHDLPSFFTAFAFSIATAMSAGYGDVAAVGVMRMAVLLETVICLFLFSALVSKILGAQQEQTLAEIRRITFENRLGRVRTNVHLVLADLSDISRSADAHVTPRRLRGRIESAAMIFASELKAARDLLHGRPADADDFALEALFACFAAGLEELGSLLTGIMARDRSGSLRRSLRAVAQLGTDLCTVPATRPTQALALTLDRVQRQCRALSDELRPGDTAPRFALPASDGKVYRLADHFARNTVVLVWFPKAFTGG